MLYVWDPPGQHGPCMVGVVNVLSTPLNSPVEHPLRNYST